MIWTIFSGERCGPRASCFSTLFYNCVQFAICNCFYCRRHFKMCNPTPLTFIYNEKCHFKNNWLLCFYIFTLHLFLSFYIINFPFCSFPIINLLLKYQNDIGIKNHLRVNTKYKKRRYGPLMTNSMFKMVFMDLVVTFTFLFCQLRVTGRNVATTGSEGMTLTWKGLSLGRQTTVQWVL